MTRLLGLLLAIVLVAGGCASDTGTNAGDLATVAKAIRAVEQKGAAFSYKVTVVSTGGSIPKGKEARIPLSGVGVARDDNASFVLSELDQAGKPVGAFDLVINDVYLFVRPHAVARAWFVGAASGFNYFYPAVRLNLLRETVLLASKSSKATTFSSGSFSNQYTITAAPDQLQQLLSVSVGTDKQSAFLKSASATIDAYLTTGGQLQRITVQAAGTDPVTSVRSVYNSSLTISRVGEVSDPSVPTNAVSVQPGDMFSTGAVPTGP
ncbi:MAG: hypothetical protein M3Z98_00825 [Candidatus Dormibacteraeota bacterium]|nr:hypothetical protein [Candidatus Dormibacteraeota bacterium]MDQ6917877.1 hypothetical protein [Candidatus Dormibacteraeota bacterium]